jgi:riboflavin kinase/FMN adenylyltransferase
LTWTDRKADLLAELGVDVVVAYPTDHQLLSLSYHEFFHQIVVGLIGARALVEGPNFFFGRGREGNVEKLAVLCRQNDIRLEIVKPITLQDDFISSSRIRNLISDGQVADAARLLTRPYRIRGLVTHGASRGASIGFPTANLDAIDTLIPESGVYAGITHLDGRAHWSAINIGPNLTFGESVRKVEVHILDFENSIYGQAIEVDFVERLRDIRRFESAEELKQQIQHDVAETRKIARRAAAPNFPAGGKPSE